MNKTSRGGSVGGRAFVHTNTRRKHKRPTSNCSAPGSMSSYGNLFDVGRFFARSYGWFGDVFALAA